MTNPILSDWSPTAFISAESEIGLARFRQSTADFPVRTIATHTHLPIEKVG